MPPIGPEAIADVVSACQENADEIAQSFTRAFEIPCQLAVGLGTTWDAKAHLEGLQGPGLAFVLRIGETAMVAVLAESSGLLPDWYTEPGPTGASRLATLAQELSMLVVPDSVAIEDSAALPLASLSGAILAAEPAAAAARVPLVLHFGQEQRASLSLVWPLTAPDKLNEAAPAAAPGAAASASQSAVPAMRVVADDGGLPAYTRSLLRVKVPVSVALASKKRAVSKILELGIGSIIHFDKPCDDPLDLEVNGHRVAQGEAVKVGDKFGLRVQSIVLPSERFNSLKRGDPSH